MVYFSPVNNGIFTIFNWLGMRFLKHQPYGSSILNLHVIFLPVFFLPRDVYIHTYMYIVYDHVYVYVFMIQYSIICHLYHA